MEIKIKKCPRCGQKNVYRANFCTAGCGYCFPADDVPGSSPNPKPDPPGPVSGGAAPVGKGGDYPILEFERKSDEILSQIKGEIESCRKFLKSLGEPGNDSDEVLRKSYESYVANFECMDASMKNIEALSKAFEGHYAAAEAELNQGLPARKKSLRRAYEEKAGTIVSSVTEFVDGLVKQKPYNRGRGFQVTPIENWDSNSLPSRMPRHFLYLGKIHRRYTLLGQDFNISRREYLELLNFKNLVIRYDGKSEEKSVRLVTTFLGRILKETDGQMVQIHVIDPELGLGPCPDLNRLPPDIYSVEKDFDTAAVLRQEVSTLRMTEGMSVEEYNRSRRDGDTILNYHVVVFQDWLASLQGRIDEDEMRGVIANSLKAGYCFIFMVNDDKPSGFSHSRHDDDMQSLLAECTVIDLRVPPFDKGRKLELMDEARIFDVVKAIRNSVSSRTKDIDIGALLEEQKRWGPSSCRDGISLAVGMDSALQRLELQFTDDIIHQSLLVNYRSSKSNVFQWINAMVAQAFTAYSPDELHVMVADFTGSDALSALTRKRNLTEPPFYFLGRNDSNSLSYREWIGNQFPRIFPSYFANNSEKRLLTFVVGRVEEFKKYIIDKSYLLRDRLHLVLLTTDFLSDDTGRQRGFEGYQLSFGPRRIEGSTGHYRNQGKVQEVSGDEFLFEGSVCQAYTYDAESTGRILEALFRDPVAQGPVPVRDDPRTDKDADVGEEGKTVVCKSVEPMEGMGEPAPVETAETAAAIAASKESLPSAGRTDESKDLSDAKGVPPVGEGEIVPGSGETGPPPVTTVVDPAERYDYQRTFRFRDYMLPESKWWTESCAAVMEVPFGIHMDRETDRDEICSFQFINDETGANAALVLGRSGWGKTTFLQSLIMSAAQRYSPKELEFYLIDFKTVGFLPFERYRLPHVRVVASGADREFGLSILEKLNEELHQRMQHPESCYPRTVLIIDECQDFFLRDDSLAEKATVIIEFLLKKGRQFGINIILSTQELSSPSTSVPSSLYQNTPIRVVARPTPPDYMNLFDRTSSTELETLNTSYKTGELLFVRDTYMKGNASIEDYHAKSFYIQYNHSKMEDSELKDLVVSLARFAETHKEACPDDMGMFVFHNDAPLVEFSNKRMSDAHRSIPSGLPKEIPMYLGQPIAIDEDLYLALTQTNYQNVLTIGLSDAEVGQGITFNALLSSLMAYPQDKRIDYVFDFTIRGEPLFGQLEKVVGTPPFSPKSRVIPNDEERVLSALAEIKTMIEERMTHRQDDVDSHVFVTFFGLDRGNMFGIDLTKSEGYLETFFESTDLLNYIICNGPRYGVFVLVQFTGRLEQLSQKLKLSVGYGLFNHVIALQIEESESLTLICD